MKELFIAAMMVAGVAKAQSLNQTASFSTGGGNGGDAVVCGNKVYMLDYIEAFGTDLTYEINEPIFETLEQLIEPVKHTDSLLYKTINDVAEKFKVSMKINSSKTTIMTNDVDFTEMKLPNLDDEGSFEYPSYCKVEQLIIRKDPTSLSSQEFILRNDLWNKMSNYQKVSAIIHEGVFKHLLKGGHQDSAFSRKLGISILKNKLKDISDKEYLELLASKNFNNYIQKDLAIFTLESDFTYSAAGELVAVNKSELGEDTLIEYPFNNETFNAYEINFHSGIVTGFTSNIENITLNKVSAQAPFVVQDNKFLPVTDIVPSIYWMLSSSGGPQWEWQKEPKHIHFSTKYANVEGDFPKAAFALYQKRVDVLVENKTFIIGDIYKSELEKGIFFLSDFVGTDFNAEKYSFSDKKSNQHSLLIYFDGKITITE